MTFMNYRARHPITENVDFMPILSMGCLANNIDYIDGAIEPYRLNVEIDSIAILSMG